MFMQPSGIHLTIDLKKIKQRNTGYSLLSELLSAPLFDFKAPS